MKVISLVVIHARLLHWLRMPRQSSCIDQYVDSHVAQRDSDREGGLSPEKDCSSRSKDKGNGLCAKSAVCADHVNGLVYAKF